MGAFFLRESQHHEDLLPGNDQTEDPAGVSFLSFYLPVPDTSNSRLWFPWKFIHFFIKWSFNFFWVTGTVLAVKKWDQTCSLIKLASKHRLFFLMPRVIIKVNGIPSMMISIVLGKKFIFVLWNCWVSRYLDADLLSSLHVLICVFPFQEISYFSNVFVQGVFCFPLPGQKLL